MYSTIFKLALASYFLLTQPYLLNANTHSFLAECKPNGYIVGKATKQCSECCKANVRYTTYDCSPPVQSSTPARLTLNSFAEGGDGGGPSECDNKYHPDTELVVALSTGWYHKGSRCGKKIKINGKGKSVLAKVVDECDSMKGCDKEHAYQPPCRNNIVDASIAVWKKLGYTGKEDDYGDAKITWSDVVGDSDQIILMPHEMS